MPITLKNSNFELTLVKAGEQYTGCRFDYNGSIIQIAYKGLNLCGKEVLDCDFDQSKNGQGLYGEFGIKNVVGYDDEDIKEGDWFPKIGTGWLKKDSKSYFFANNYEMESIDFSYEEKQNSVIFTCNSGVRNGYGYIYTKTVELLEDGFVINYSLKNTGTKAINTTEYVHNFFNPGQTGINTNLQFSINWDFTVEKLIENVKTSGVLEISTHSAKLLKQPQSDFFLGGIWQARTYPSAVQNLKGKWELTDTLHSLCITEKDSFTPCGCDLWGYSNNISPEMFAQISVEPGQTQTWQRKYIIQDL